jgi:hypothetical protein
VTWADARHFLLRAYADLRDVGNRRLELEVFATTVRLSARDGWLEIVGVVGETRAVPPLYSLRVGAEAAIGRICTIDGALALRQLLLLDGLAAADLVETVAVIAQHCESTRRQLS